MPAPAINNMWDFLRSETLTQESSPSTSYHVSSSSNSPKCVSNENKQEQLDPTYSDAWVNFSTGEPTEFANGQHSNMLHNNGPAAAVGGPGPGPGPGPAHQQSSMSSTRRHLRARSSSRDSHHSAASSSSCYVRKSVTFAPAVRVHLTVGRWELTEEEIHDTWLTSDDTRLSQDGILDTVRAMRKLLTPDGQLGDAESYLMAKDHTSRGVEHMRTRESISERRNNKLDVADAVLEEQHRQRTEGIDNPVALAEASMLVSKKCRTKAATKGAEDAACARVLNRIPRPQEHGIILNKTSKSSKSSSRSSSRRSSSGNGNKRPIVQEGWASAFQVDQQDAKCDQEGGRLTPEQQAEKAEVDSMFTNISHQKLREKLMQRVTGIALGA